MISSTWETAAILDKASPRNPSEAMFSRSSTFSILLVAWRRKASGTCSASIPEPLSVIRISFFPPSVISTVIAVAPASMAFSTSSFTTEEGRSTTSPAAILSMVFWSKTAIFLKVSPPVLYFVLQIIENIQGLHWSQVANLQAFDLFDDIIILHRVKE